MKLNNKINNKNAQLIPEKNRKRRKKKLRQNEIKNI